MGGCASKPNDLDGRNPEAVPAEGPSAPDVTVKPGEDADAPAAAESKAKTAAEEPLVDLSEPQPEVPRAALTEDESTAPGVSELHPKTLLEAGDAKEKVPEKVPIADEAVPVKEAAKAVAAGTEKF